MSNSRNVRTFEKEIFNSPDMETKLENEIKLAKKCGCEYELVWTKCSVFIRIEVETTSQVAKFKFKANDYEELRDE